MNYQKYTERYWLTLSFRKIEYAENAEFAAKFHYFLHFDIQILPSLRVRHTKGDWSITFSWLLWGLFLWIKLPIKEYLVYFNNKDSTLPKVRVFNNFIEAVKFSLMVDGAIKCRR